MRVMKKYSCLRFQMDIEPETMNMLLEQAKNGTKVYFFTYDPIDQLILNHEVKKLVDEQFIFLYEIAFNEQLTVNFTYYDGQVPESILNLLAELTPELPFNKEQFKVEHADIGKNIIVSAGAGTGKTTVMINRILYLKYKQPDLNFSELALITFTNKAALHIRKKLVDKIKLYFKVTNDFKYLRWLRELKHMSIGTIHSFAYQLLQINQNDLFDRLHLPITQFKYDRRKIIEEVINDFHEKYPEQFSRFKYIQQYKIVSAIEAMIEQINNHSISLKQVENLSFGVSDNESHLLYEYVVKESINRLTQLKEEYEYMEVHDLIVKLEDIATIQSQRTIPFRYIFIDEFQDTDRQQTSFFAQLSNNNQLNLFVVGDVKQSIYRFRGADYTAFQQLKNLTEIHKEFFLQLNYRSNQQLLNEFNRLFSKWPDQVRTFKYSTEDHLLSGYGKHREEDINEAIIHKSFSTKAKFIELLQEKENTDTAILVRSNKEVNDLSLFLEERKIFFTAEQDGDFYRSVPVREFYQLILRFVQPNSWTNRYTLNSTSYGDRNIEVKEMIESFSADRTMISLLEKVDSKFNKYEKTMKSQGVFEVIYDIIDEINPAKVYAERYLSERLNLYPDEKKKSSLIERASIMQDEYEMNLNHLIYMLKKELADTVPTLYQIEKLLRLKMTTDKTMTKIKVSKEDEQRLKIMTVHKAKGLEFDYVILPHTTRAFHAFVHTDVIINNNMLGYWTSIEKGKTYVNDHYLHLKNHEREENIGEETRLLYVALTRAKKGIYLDAPLHSNNYRIRNWGDLIAEGYTTSTHESMV